MPELWEIKKGITIGYKSPNKFIWAACEECGKERWVSYRKGKPKYNICYSCSAKRKIGDRGSSWKGGRVKRGNGYIEIWISPDDFFFSMANKGKHVPEHRLVMAKHLRRCLQPWEIVHHKNGIKGDNRIENLELTANSSEHSIMHSKGYRDGFNKGYQDGRDKRIKALVYLWTRDAEFPVNSDTEEYIKDHLKAISKHAPVFSDEIRAQMATRILEED